MENIFKNAYFGKPYKTRDGRRALFMRKDEGTFDLETEESYNPVRADGTFLYTKEGYESSCDIVSEWQEEINEEELEELADDASLWLADVPLQERRFKEGFKAGFRKAKELYDKK